MLRWGLAPAVVSWQRPAIHISLARHSPEFLCWNCATSIRIRFANIVPPLSRSVVQDENSWALCFGRATDHRLVGYHNGVVCPTRDLGRLVEKRVHSCFCHGAPSLTGEVDSGSCRGKQFAWDMHCNIQRAGLTNLPRKNVFFLSSPWFIRSLQWNSLAKLWGPINSALYIVHWGTMYKDLKRSKKHGKVRPLQDLFLII